MVSFFSYLTSKVWNLHGLSSLCLENWENVRIFAATASDVEKFLTLVVQFPSLFEIISFSADSSEIFLLPKDFNFPESAKPRISIHYLWGIFTDSKISDSQALFFFSLLVLDRYSSSSLQTSSILPFFVLISLGIELSFSLSASLHTDFLLLLTFLMESQCIKQLS